MLRSIWQHAVHNPDCMLLSVSPVQTVRTGADTDCDAWYQCMYVDLDGTHHRHAHRWQHWLAKYIVLSLSVGGASKSKILKPVFCICYVSYISLQLIANQPFSTSIQS